MTTPPDEAVVLASEEPKEANHKKISSKYYLLALINLLFLAGIAYYIYQLKTSQQKYQTQIETLFENQTSFKNDQSQINHQFNDMIKSLLKTQDKQLNTLQLFDKNLQTALKETSYQSNDWILLKARYFLELAQINAEWSDNKQLTPALLQQADALLSTLQSQSVSPIRIAIAKELTHLRTIKTIDITGLLSEISGMESVIPNLPFKKSALAPWTSVKLQKTNPDSWQEKLQTSLSKLNKLVVIRHYDGHIEPINPIYENMVREIIRFNLQEAQWSILEHNNTIYQLALKQAINNLNRSFDVNSQPVQTILKQIEKLQTIDVTLHKVIPIDSLPLLEQLIQSKSAPLKPNPSTTEEGNAHHD